jgi:small subunit ribosomal protein S17
VNDAQPGGAQAQPAEQSVEDRVKHPKYGKVIRRTKKYTAHDADNACGVGDRVLLMETRPLSATKRWRVAKILEKAK